MTLGVLSERALCRHADPGRGGTRKDLRIGEGSRVYLNIRNSTNEKQGWKVARENQTDVQAGSCSVLVLNVERSSESIAFANPKWALGFVQELRPIDWPLRD